MPGFKIEVNFPFYFFLEGRVDDESIDKLALLVNEPQFYDDSRAYENKVKNSQGVYQLDTDFGAVIIKNYKRLIKVTGGQNPSKDSLRDLLQRSFDEYLK